MIRSLAKHHHLMWSYLKGLLLCFRRPVFVFLVFLSATIISVCALAFYALEGGGINSSVRGLLDAFYFSVTTICGVGYGDITPVTPLGRILAMAMMLLGTAVFVSLTAVLSTSLMELEMELGHGSWRKREKDNTPKTTPTIRGPH